MTVEERESALASIKAGLVRQDFYLMIRQPNDHKKKTDLLLEHLQWIVELERQGRIVFTGALFDREGLQLDGITVLRAADWDEAERLAGTDPQVRSGAVSCIVRRWAIGAGTISVSVDLSTRDVRFG